MGQKEDNCIADIIFRQLKQSFHAICLTLLSLLLPLSYLLFPRLNSPPPLSLTFNTIIFYIFISFLSLSSLFYSFTGHTLLIKLPICIAWAFLCLFQACVTSGIEATIRSEFEPLENTSGTAHETWLKKTLFFIGIYEQMMLWEMTLVKPVVDDAIYDEERKERGIERFIMWLSFSGLWLWLLQREIEPLVLASGRGELRNEAGWSNFILWLVTVATLLTGFVSAVKFLVWQIIVLLQFMYCRVDQEDDGHRSGDNEV